MPDCSSPARARGSAASPIIGSIAYKASDQTYTLRLDGRLQNFLPSEIDAAASNDRVTVYRQVRGVTTETLTLTKAAATGPFNYRYVGAAIWRRNSGGAGATVNGFYDALIYGIPTLASAIPTSGQADYTVGVLGTRFNINGMSPVDGEGHLMVDFGTGALNLHSLLVSGALNGQIDGTAQIGSGNAFNGNLTANIDTTQFAGGWAGLFFGPNAEEIGATFQSGSGRDTPAMNGAIVGRRD